jgi:hypothetical protein
MNRSAFLSSLPFLYPSLTFDNWPGRGEVVLREANCSIEPREGHVAFFETSFMSSTGATAHATPTTGIHAADAAQATFEMALEPIVLQGVSHPVDSSSSIHKVTSPSLLLLSPQDKSMPLYSLKMRIDEATYQVNVQSLQSIQFVPSLTDTSNNNSITKPCCWLWTWPSVVLRIYSTHWDEEQGQRLHERIQSILPYVRVTTPFQGMTCDSDDTTPSASQEGPAQVVNPPHKRPRTGHAEKSRKTRHWHQLQSCHKHIQELPRLLSRPAGAHDMSISWHLTETAQSLAASYVMDNRISATTLDGMHHQHRNPHMSTTTSSTRVRDELDSSISTLRLSIESSLNAYFPVRPKGRGVPMPPTPTAQAHANAQSTTQRQLEQYLREHRERLQEKSRLWLLPTRDGALSVLGL